MGRHASRTIRVLGRDALQISAVGAIGSDAQLHEIDQHLLAVRAARGAGELLAEMDRALVFLRRANRRLERGLERLDAVAARFHDLQVQGSPAHALTWPSPAIASMATDCGSSLRRLLRAFRASNAGNYVALLQLLAGRRQDLRARTAMRFDLEFSRFSGPLEVRSRRDLAEVFALSRPHADEAGIPRRRVVVVVGGIDSLPEAIPSARSSMRAYATEDGSFTA